MYTTRSSTRNQHRWYGLLQPRIAMIISFLFLIISLLSASATNVKFIENKNIAPEHIDAHTAPRSQKYWDEHNIKRPDYAKTDAELRAERGGASNGGLLGTVMIVSIVMFILVTLYVRVTGDWDTILNNPVGSFVYGCVKRIGDNVSGQKLGSNTERSTVANDDEARRNARLARFDNPDPKDMLDSLKSD